MARTRATKCRSAAGGRSTCSTACLLWESPFLLKLHVLWGPFRQIHVQNKCLGNGERQRHPIHLFPKCSYVPLAVSCRWQKHGLCSAALTIELLIFSPLANSGPWTGQCDCCAHHLLHLMWLLCQWLLFTQGPFNQLVAGWYFVWKVLLAGVLLLLDGIGSDGKCMDRTFDIA